MDHRAQRHSELPPWGRLGGLAGGKLGLVIDLELPFVAVTRVIRAGNFRQGIDAYDRQGTLPIR